MNDRGDRPGDGDLDVDAAWAEIVAHWDADDLRVVVDDDEDPQDPQAPSEAEPESTGMTWTEVGLEDWSGDPVGPAAPPVRGEVRPVGRSPRYDEVDDAPDRPGQDDDAPRLGWDAIRPHVGGEAVRASAARDDDEDGALAALDDHFVPDEPPSLRPTDPVSALAWLGALGGPLFLLVAALAWRTAPSVLIGAAVLAFVAGFVTLVVRMPDEREDTDDGAVV